MILKMKEINVRIEFVPQFARNDRLFQFHSKFCLISDKPKPKMQIFKI